MGRSAPDAAGQRCIDELAARGVRVVVSLGDVADAADCAAAVATATRNGPLRLVFHLAGATADGAFATLSDDAFDTPFSGKVYGAWQVTDAVRGQDLTAFVLFSSVSSVLGSAGQANYAAANGYLNGLAMALRAQGVRYQHLLGPMAADGQAWYGGNPRCAGGGDTGGGPRAGRR